MVVDLGLVEWIAGIAATAPGEWAAAERHHEEIRPPDPSGVDQVGPMPGPVTEQTADTYSATFDTNVLGTLLSMKHELRVMPRAKAASSTFRLPTATLGRQALPFTRRASMRWKD
jgi:NAD(P)-dependent dehydrogenase (short-subunit alcohol dehydrogenase family)